MSGELSPCRQPKTHNTCRINIFTSTPSLSIVIEYAMHKISVIGFEKIQSTDLKFHFCPSYLYLYGTPFRLLRRRRRRRQQQQHTCIHSLCLSLHVCTRCSCAIYLYLLIFVCSLFPLLFLIFCLFRMQENIFPFVNEQWTRQIKWHLPFIHLFDKVWYIYVCRMCVVRCMRLPSQCIQYHIPCCCCDGGFWR